MTYFKISFGIFIALAASRFIPHPPNFTSLIALGFYVPCILGRKYIPALILCFIFTDLLIGFHKTILFTWGSIIFIGLISQYFIKTKLSRILGVLSCAFLFFIITNFGIWSLGYYDYTIKGILECYIMAIPFFGQTLISTLFYSFIIELIYSLNLVQNYIKIKL